VDLFVFWLPWRQPGVRWLGEIVRFASIELALRDVNVHTVAFEVVDTECCSCYMQSPDLRFPRLLRLVVPSGAPIVDWHVVGGAFVFDRSATLTTSAVFDRIASKHMRRHSRGP
jgi:hypothetical protein